MSREGFPTQTTSNLKCCSRGVVKLLQLKWFLSRWILKLKFRHIDNGTAAFFFVGNGFPAATFFRWQWMVPKPLLHNACFIALPIMGRKWLVRPQESIKKSLAFTWHQCSLTTGVFLRVMLTPQRCKMATSDMICHINGKQWQAAVS